MKNITTFDFAELNKFDKVFCLVSGGFDSTYLYEMCKQHVEPFKLYPVNCYNPFEMNKTLALIAKEPRYISVRPDTRVDYLEVLKDSFMRIPAVQQVIREHKRDKENPPYNKDMFPCCKIIKHEAFQADPLFKEPNTVVISGITAGESQNRAFLLGNLRSGRNPADPDDGTINPPTFYYRKKLGQLYCYPLRDYFQRELPKDIARELRKRYPDLCHSGCRICPFIVAWKQKHAENYKQSMKFWHDLDGFTSLDDFSGYKPCMRNENLI